LWELWGVLRSQFLESTQDGSENVVEVGEHLCVIESQDSDSPFGEDFIAGEVLLLSLLVNRTIQFDREVVREAVKVDDPITKDVLVSEFYAKLSLPDFAPQNPLRQGLVVS
jgi:hypothetical protein